MRLLLVEDEHTHAGTFQPRLSGAFPRAKTRIVTSLNGALAALERTPYTAAVLDLDLPGAGVDTVEAIRARHPTLPVIVVSADGDVEIARRVVERGAHEFVHKTDATADALKRAITYALERNRQEDRLRREVIKLAALNRSLKRISQMDPLTGLANRARLEELTRVALSRASRHGHMLALLYFDLDGFKSVNDAYGHEAGDQLLRAVAATVLEHMRAEDRLARLGGDEFVLLLEDVQRPADALAAASKIVAEVARPIEINGNEIRVRVSVGIALYPTSTTFDDLLAHADAAMYSAKRSHSHKVQFFDRRLAREVSFKSRVDSCLKRALDDDELSLVYQPIMARIDNRIAGVEALLRWHSRVLGDVAPDVFITHAETTGGIEHLDGFAMTRSISDFARWRRSGLPLDHLHLNVSVRTLNNDYVERLVRSMDAAGIPAGRVVLEITETSVTQSVRELNRTLRRLKHRGVRLALDDFGSGYASLKQIKQLPFDTLKIDRSLVDGLHQQRRNQVLCRATVEMARALGMEVVAEGIESREDLAIARDIPFNYLQGFGIGRPAAAEAIPAALAA